MGCVSSSDCAWYLKQHLKEPSTLHKKWESEKVYTVNCIGYILVEAIDCQLVFKVCISAKLVDVWAINHVGYGLGPWLDPAGWGPDRPVEDWLFEPFRLPVHLHHHCPLTLQVHCEEGLNRCVAVDENCIITNCMNQDVRDWTEDEERVLLEQKGCAASAS